MFIGCSKSCNKDNNYSKNFVIKEGLNINQREIKALIKASDLLKCKDLLIITWDYEDELKIENKTIKYIPLWKWLLNI